MGTFDTISNTTYEDIGSGRQFDVSWHRAPTTAVLWYSHAGQPHDLDHLDPKLPVAGMKRYAESD